MRQIRDRKLNNRQLQRLKKKQKNAQVQDDPTWCEALVVSHYGRQMEVKLTTAPTFEFEPPKAAAGEPEAFFKVPQVGQVWRAHARASLKPAAAGDNVRVSLDPLSGLATVEVVLPRRSVIERPDRYRKVKPVAANIDTMVIVFAPVPAGSAELIDRYLVIASVSKIKPVLVLNKDDLPNHESSAQLLAEYAKLGVECFKTNKFDPLSSLKEELSGKTVVFVGQSGVGKSSLINALEPSASQKINAISENSELGQHTTTTSRVVEFAGGALIDSPGVREYGLWHLNPEDLSLGFKDVEEHAGFCKFRNCMHLEEPGCAVRLAVEQGQLLDRRLISFHKLIEELKAHEDKPTSK